MSDLGIPAALQNHVTLLLAEHEEERRLALVSHAFQLLTNIGSGAAIVGIVVSCTFPWSRVFGVNLETVGDFRWSLIICLLAFAVGLPTRIAGALFSAHGRIALPPVIEIVSQLGSFALLLLAVSQHWSSIVALAFCNLAGVVFGPVVAIIIAFALFQYRPWQTRSAYREDRRLLVNKGSFFFFTAIGELLVLHTDAFVIAYVLGPAAVPRYLIPSSLFVNFLLFQNTLLRPLWPVLTKCHLNGDTDEVRRTIGRLLRWSLLSALGSGVSFVVAGDWFIRLWSHEAASLPPVMAWGMAAYVVVASIDNVFATVLNSFGLIEVRLCYTLALGVVKILVGFAVLHFANMEYLPMAYAGVMLIVSVMWAGRALKGALRTLSKRNRCGGAG